MFSIERKTEEGFEKIILKETAANTSVEIIPSCGAILHAFNVIYNDRPLNIIANYADLDDFKKNVTLKGFRSCKLSPFACRVKNAAYTFNGIKYKLDKFLLNENALHGLLYDAKFEIISELMTEDYASIGLSYKYSGNENGFPFQYDCNIIYKLQRENALTITTTIINRSGELMPIQDGWHPYFTFGKNIDDLQLKFEAKEKVEMNGELIPTGKLLRYDKFNSSQQIGNVHFDDCFTLNFEERRPLCILKDTKNQIKLEVMPTNSYPYLQIYTPSDRKSIAIENLSAAPDTFNNAMGLKILVAGETAVFETTYKITLLS